MLCCLCCSIEMLTCGIFCKDLNQLSTCNYRTIINNKRTINKRYYYRNVIFPLQNASRVLFLINCLYTESTIKWFLLRKRWHIILFYAFITALNSSSLTNLSIISLVSVTCYWKCFLTGRLILVLTLETPCHHISFRSCLCDLSITT